MTAMTPEVTPLGAATLARKWRIDVNTGTKTVPAWKRIRGVSDFTPSDDPSTQDTTDYDSQGFKSSTVTAIGWGIELTCERKVGDDGLTYDPAQEFLRTHAGKLGVDNVVEVRWYEWNGELGPVVEAYQGMVGVQWAEQAGAPDGKSTAKITLTGQGMRTSITHPLLSYVAAAWQATHAYTLSAKVLVGAAVLEATTAGTSGSTIPTAPASVGGTVTDGTVVWTRRS